MKSIAFIGDVHGCFEPLEAITQIALQEADQLVFLGDYVNRGRSSSQVIEFLVQLSADFPERSTFLRGNHDLALAEVLDGASADVLLQMGGAPTIRSYVRPPYVDVEAQLRLAVPETHVGFLGALTEEFRAPGILALHDGSNVGTIENQYVVSGHSIRGSMTPVIETDRAFIDTGCGTISGGRLTCLLWPSLQYFQEAAPRI